LHPLPPPPLLLDDDDELDEDEDDDEPFFHPPPAVPSHSAPKAEHALGHVLAASRQRPFVQLRALTGGPELQSQNQLGQSSPVEHAGPCGLPLEPLEPLVPLEPLLPEEPLDPLLPEEPSVGFCSVLGLFTSVESEPEHAMRMQEMESPIERA